VTLGAEASVIPGFEDRMTDFTSEGPARITSDLKPDISAPGSDITSAAVGTGNGAATFSGTSMAAPHVSGVAVLLRQLHPDFSPEEIKALLMNQAKLGLSNNDGSGPVPAEAMGSGRVQAFESATAASLVVPGSLSFGLRPVPNPVALRRTIRVENLDRLGHDYDLSASVRYADYSRGVADVRVSPSSFHLNAGGSRTVTVRLTVDPDPISPGEQLYGWYYFMGSMDGSVRIRQSGGSPDTLHVPWHVVPLSTSRNGISTNSLDLGKGSASFEITDPPAAGVPYADLYLLGARDPKDTGGEEDIAAVGARSFTGPVVDGKASGLPRGIDPLAGLTWVEFLENEDRPAEPVEFGVRTYGIRNTTETLEVDVLVDAGADGVFADPELKADYMVVKQTGPGGNVCVYDLSLASPFDACMATYFADYTNYNGDVVGLAVDASAIGLSSDQPELAYQVTACTGVFSGDVPAQVCDTAGAFDPATGTYGPRLNATAPALAISPLVCRGFWHGGACTGDRPVSVKVGSAAPGDNPSILVLFPNNAPGRSGRVLTTGT